MRQIIGILIIFLSTQLVAQELATFSVRIDESYIDMPVSFPLDPIDYNTDSLQLALYEMTGSEPRFIPSQLETGHNASLWFVLEGLSRKNTTRKFVIRKIKPAPDEQTDNRLQMRKADGNLTLYADQSPIFSYRYETMFPPRGVRSLV